MTGKLAFEMHTMVKESNFVVKAADFKKPGFRATGKARFVPKKDGASIRHLLETCFDPMIHVGHLVSVTLNSLQKLDVDTDTTTVRPSDH